MQLNEDTPKPCKQRYQHSVHQSESQSPQAREYLGEQPSMQQQAQRAHAHMQQQKQRQPEQ